MELPLDPVEVRVLGSLLEKEITTPEYYPLTLNALVNACNQKSNRDPVVQFDDSEVEEALRRLQQKRLTTNISGAGSRVVKYGHRLTDALNLGRREYAVLCELMVRGPQTLGELRSRSERMTKFTDLDEVELTLTRLAEREQPLVTKFPPAPGRKEPRYAHLLGGEPVMESGLAASAATPKGDRIGTLEAEVTQLREEVAALRAIVEAFQRQFE